jgi:maleate isomerase
MSRYEGPVEFDSPAEQRRVGVVVPFDFSLDWEYWRYLPEGVELHFTRTPHLQRDDGMYLARACGKPSVVARAARSLLSVRPHSTLFACTSGSFVHGVEGEAELRAAMVEAGCERPVTSSGAAMAALRRAGAQRVAVTAPYSGALTRQLVRFVEDSGFEVTSAHYLGLHRDIAHVSLSTVADLVRQTADSGADAVFVSCTSLRTFGVVAQLEGELGIPVFTSNQVSLWAALDRAGALEGRRASDGGTWQLGDGDPVALSTRILLGDATAPVLESPATVLETAAAVLDQVPAAEAPIALDATVEAEGGEGPCEAEAPLAPSPTDLRREVA